LNQASYTDIELLEGLSKGDSNAIEAFYNQYQRIWMKWVLSHGGMESDADDVFQEAMLVIYEKSKSVEFCLTCRLSTYLFAVCKRMWYRKLERNSRVNLKEDWDDNNYRQDSSTEDLDNFLEKEQQFDQLSEALQKLGAPCSELLKGFYMEQKSMQDLAKAFNYTNSENAKTQKYKCLNRLRKLFFEQSISKSNKEG